MGCMKILNGIELILDDQGIIWTHIQSVWNHSCPLESPTSHTFFAVSYSKPALALKLHAIKKVRHLFTEGHVRFEKKKIIELFFTIISCQIIARLDIFPSLFSEIHSSSISPKK